MSRIFVLRGGHSLLYRLLAMMCLDRRACHHRGESRARLSNIYLIDEKAGERSFASERSAELEWIRSRDRDSIFGWDCCRSGPTKPPIKCGPQGRRTPGPLLTGAAFAMCSSHSSNLFIVVYRLHRYWDEPSATSTFLVEVQSCSGPSGFIGPCVVRVWLLQHPFGILPAWWWSMAPFGDRCYWSRAMSSGGKSVLLGLGRVRGWGATSRPQ